MKSTAAIPPAGEPLQPDWLSDVLIAAGWLQGGRVAAIEHEALHEATAFVGEVWRLSLTYFPGVPHMGSMTGPASVIVKRPTPVAQNRAIGQMLALYEREQRFYRELAAQSAIRVPQLIHAAASADYDENILILEDLEPLSVGNQLAGWTRAQAENAVLAVARQHAAWWDDARLDALDWLPRWGEPRLAPILKGGYANALGPFVDRYRDTLSSSAIAAAERMVDAFDTVADRIGAPPRTLLHGDFRADNLFFGPDGAFAAVDWQLAASGRGIFDLAYLMTQSGEPAERRAIEEPLIERYLAALEADGVDQASAAALREDYRWCVLYTLVYAVIAGGSFAPPNERATRLMDALTLRTAAAIDDHKAGDLIGA